MTAPQPEGLDMTLTIEQARHIAAQCWCEPETSGIEMDARLAEAFARALLSASKPAVQAHCQCSACKDGAIHASDCAVHNAPALPVGECNCGAAAPAQSAEPVKIHKLWAHGGCTGINDYLMTDFSIRTLKVSEIKRGQTFPANDGSHETVSRDNPYAASLAAPQPSQTAVVLDERAAFEAFWENDNVSFPHHESDPIGSHMETAWEAWQARSAFPQPVAQPVEQALTLTDDRRAQIEEAICSLERAGFRHEPGNLRALLADDAVAQPVEQTRALTTATTVSLIIRDVCEAEPDDPEHTDTICIGVEYLRDILERWIERAAARPASGETE